MIGGPVRGQDPGRSGWGSWREGSRSACLLIPRWFLGARCGQNRPGPWLPWGCAPGRAGCQNRSPRREDDEIPISSRRPGPQTLSGGVWLPETFRLPNLRPASARPASRTSFPERVCPPRNNSRVRPAGSSSAEGRGEWGARCRVSDGLAAAGWGVLWRHRHGIHPSTCPAHGRSSLPRACRARQMPWGVRSPSAWPTPPRPDSQRRRHPHVKPGTSSYFLPQHLARPFN